MEDNDYYIQVDIWKNSLIATDKKTTKEFAAEIIEGSLNSKVHFHGQNSMSPEAVKELCEKNNWRLASEFEVSMAWIYDGLNVYAFGQMQDGLLAVPVQGDVPNFEKGLNIMPMGSPGSGNQGFFYVEKKILTFRNLRRPVDTKRFTFKNRGMYKARYSLEYMVQGKTDAWSSGEISREGEIGYNIPEIATNVKVIAEGATGFVWEPWRTHFDKTYPSALDKTIESLGTTLNQYATES